MDLIQYNNVMAQNASKFIYWAPRILSILFIIFLSLFSLDIFNLSLGFWQTLLGLLMHNIPAIILSTILLISWKYEIVGAVTLIGAGIFYFVMITIDQFAWYKISWALAISGPAFLIGILFYINWMQKKK